MYRRTGNFEQVFADEFLLIEKAFEGEHDYLWFTPKGAALSKPREGMISYADGTNWNPGYGAGHYSYKNSTNGWERLLTSHALKVKEGSNMQMGVVTLVGGSASVSNTRVTNDSRIFVTSQVDGGTPGWLRVSARTASTSFTITSSSATDTSTVAWLLVEPS